MVRKWNYLFIIIVAFLFQPFVQARYHSADQPGQFDFYVLSLSWSPSYCEDIQERGRTSSLQCGARPYSFVVHGLWPQFERGFPKYCQNPPPRLNRHIVSSMLDLMPARQLIYHEWDEHGTCTDMNPHEYFDTIRKVRAMIKIPPEFTNPTKTVIISPQDIKAAFLRSNPGLYDDSIAITCNRKRLSEVRICLTKDFKSHPCPGVLARACRRPQVVMPPLRGGNLGSAPSSQ